MNVKLEKEKFLQYATLKMQVRDLEAKISVAGKEIMGILQEKNLDKVNSEFGTFSIAKRKNWSYSKNVEVAENALIELKKIEQAGGQATFKESNILVFISKKDET